MTRTLHIAFAAAASLTLTACGFESVSSRYDLVHQIEVDSAPQILELPVADRFEDRDARRIDLFARNFLASSESALTIAYPHEMGTAAEPTVRNIVRQLRASGIPSNRILRGPYSTEADGDRGVVLSYNSRVAYGAPCPDIEGDSTRDVSNQTPRYFGCAHQNNLAVMVDRPLDLVEPRPLTPADATRRTEVVDLYRQGQDTSANRDADSVDTRID